MIFGVVVAGGVGSRLGADMPKQFLNLAGRPIIMHTLGTFLKCPELEQIYLFYEGTEHKISYGDRELTLNRLKVAKRDGTGTKARS